MYDSDHIEVDRWSEYLSFDEETHFRAIEYLRAKGEETGENDGERPFHLTVSYHHPHEPFWPPQEYWDRYSEASVDLPDIPDDIEEHRSVMDEWVNEWHEADEFDSLDAGSLRQVRRGYYGLVSYVDDKLGELLDVLEETDLADDTVVIFCSDHGDMLFERGMVQKRTFYEWSSRVPLVARFPDGTYAGTACETPVSLIDLLPTFLDIAGVPESDRLSTDGRSLFETLAGEAEGRVVFSEYHSEGVDAPCFMARRGDHKYIYVHGSDEQLFDLSEDPNEWTDRSSERSDIADTLRAEIRNEFDPDAIQDTVTRSLRRRSVVHDAMQTTGTDWAYDPPFDPTRNALDQYRPE